ncbi:methylated-DNA--[protein]-cysteine S-methyltransferase [Leucothrix arctica]|nr:methylated-DNA--[protein]-cysteine S-methyltransferase [Leucothrix arctica]
MKYFTRYPSPLGQMTLQARDAGLTGAWFEVQTTAPDDFGMQQDDHPILTQAVTELSEYFAGKRTQFDVTTVADGTDFQKQVWAMLKKIPYGETWSYQDLAIAIDNPKAVRAVGMTNGRNPISIIVPCHRVIGKNGKLTGYAGGVERKERLLGLEKMSNF